MRRPVNFAAVAAVALSGSMLAGCGSGGPSTAPSAAALATTPATQAPTAHAFTNPPPTQIPGCLPKCWFGQLTRPGPLSGEYETKYFFGGQMTVTVPDGWFGYEDSTGELSIGPAGSEDARVEFWIDVYAVKDGNGTPDDSVARTADAIIPWFLDKPIIEVVKREPTTFGGLPAEAIEYRRNDKAKNEVPDCPAEIQPCSAEFGYPEWDGSFGEGSPFHSRLVYANAMWGGERHSVYAMFWAWGTFYDQHIEQATGMIDSATLPDGVEAAPASTP